MGLVKYIIIIFVALTIKGSSAHLPLADDFGVPVLVYHHLLQSNENRYFQDNEAVITPEEFSAQMKYLYEHDFQTITLEQLEAYLDGESDLPDKSIMVTFDDGYLSNFRYAYPILKQYRFQGVIFAITGNIRQDKESFHADRLNFISWPEIPLYSDVFQIAGHSHRFHQNPYKLSYLVWKPSEEIVGDLLESQRVLPSRYFAYPFGQYSKRTKRLVHDAGYRLAFTIQGQRVYQRSNKLELGRYWIDPGMSMEQFAKIVESP